MASPTPIPAPADNRIERLVDQTNREQSPQTSDEQSGSKKSAAAAAPAVAKPAKVQPAVDAEAKLEKIDTLPSPSSSKQTPSDPPPANITDSPSLFSSFKSYTVSCAKAAKEGCGPKGLGLAFVGLLLQLLFACIHSWLVELHFACWSLIGYGLILCSKSIRGKWARQPDIQIAENKRNPYRDAPSPNDDDPMEPACPRPGRESPKEQVFKVDVHNPDLPTTLSSPSTSAAVKGADTKGASGGHPPSSAPSTSGVVVPVNVHVIPQEIESKQESSEKDS